MDSRQPAFPTNPQTNWAERWRDIACSSVVCSSLARCLPRPFTVRLRVTKRGDVSQNGEAPSVVSLPEPAPRSQITRCQAMEIVADEIISEIHDCEERARAAWQFAEEPKQHAARLILQASVLKQQFDERRSSLPQSIAASKQRSSEYRLNPHLHKPAR